MLSVCKCGSGDVKVNTGSGAAASNGVNHRSSAMHSGTALLHHVFNVESLPPTVVPALLKPNSVLVLYSLKFVSQDLATVAQPQLDFS